MITNLQRSLASLLIVSITGCAVPHKPKSIRDEQLGLSSKPNIHAVHHSPATVFMVRQHTAASLLLGTPAVENTISEGVQMQRDQQVVDPGPRVKDLLVKALQADLNLTNVFTVSVPPQDDDIQTLKNVFNTGIVLDVRTMKWGRETGDGRAKYSARARMVSLDDATVLWETTCSAHSPNRWDPLGIMLLKAADACAAQLSAAAKGSDRKPVLVTGKISVDGLPSTPRIVVDEHLIELTGFEMTPEERKRFERQREARIDSRAQVNLGGGVDPKGMLTCVAVLPVCIMVVGTAVGITSGVKRAKASAQEPSLIPEQNGARLASLLKEKATGASLAERISRLPESVSVPAAMETGSPRLVVRVIAARPDYSGTRIRVSIVAQAQAFPSTGAEWEPTEHLYEFSSLAWTTNDVELVRREIDGALDALAESISWVYLPKLPSGVPADEARKAPPMVKDNRQELDK